MTHLRRSIQPRSIAMLAALASIAAGPALAQAIEFRSLTEQAILYDTPSEQGKRLLFLRSGTPVEIVVRVDKWVKVREPGGSLSWLESRVLANRRTVLVTAERAAIRREARDDAAPSFEAVRNVVLDLVEPPSLGWARVRHRDGEEGYIRINEVWGL